VNPAADTPRTAIDATLQALLTGQLRRLRRRYLWHGLGLVAAAVGALTLLFFALDRWIGMPLPIRLFHAAALVAAAAFGAWRFVVYPLTRAFAPLDVAVWFERSFPELAQRLVSALQLQATADLRNQSQPMIDALLRETAAAVQRLPLGRMLDPRPTARALAGAAVAAGVLTAGAALQPATARAFVLRHLGADVAYPRATRLTLELPPAGADLQRADRDGETTITLPAGADLHVSVLAEGAVPKDCFLDVQALRADGAGVDTRSVAMTPRPGDRFRHVFRRATGSFRFRARGGDDDRGDRLVVVRTVLPPQVAAIAATVTPPAYAGRPATEQKGGAIESLVGSEVELTASTTAAVKSATMTFLESGRRVPLAPIAVQDDSGVAMRFRGSFRLEASDRYQIELIGDNDLRNPNPGTYPLVALQDLAPIGRWLLPDDEGALLLPTGLLCVRVEARDDFGLAAVDLLVGRGDAAPVALPMLAPDAGAAATSAVPTALHEVATLLGPRSAAPGAAEGGDGLLLTVAMRDNRQPEAGATALPRRIVQIVDEPQLAAAIARAFRALREDVAQALDLQQDRAARVDELLAGAAGTADLARAAPGVEIGQGRIRSALERAHRGLMRAFDTHLWNRLETSQNAPRVVELYVEHSRRQTEPLALDPAFYRDLADRRAQGTLGALERCLDPILAMIRLADDAAGPTAQAVARALAEAQVARDDAERRAALQRVRDGQRRLEQGLQQLLLLLQDWNDYQDLVQDVRALRDRQRDVKDRTQDLRGK
jgi:hypothetical protein